MLQEADAKEKLHKGGLRTTKPAVAKAKEAGVVHAFTDNAHTGVLYVTSSYCIVCFSFSNL